MSTIENCKFYVYKMEISMQTNVVRCGAILILLKDENNVRQLSTIIDQMSVFCPRYVYCNVIKRLLEYIKMILEHIMFTQR